MVEKHVFIERCKEEVTILAEEKNKYVQFYRNQMLRLKASIAGKLVLNTLTNKEDTL